jgi:D-alanine-D-alanine ligase-like ATP-grasp enzyme
VLETQPGFTARLKSAVCDDPLAPLVFIGNFEVETRWGRGEIGLPTIGFASSNVMVNRMDEFALLLAGPADIVLLKSAPDPHYLASLAGLGLRLPTALVAAHPEPQRTVTQDALHDPALIDQLAGLASDGAALFPHGVSADEEHLAAASGLPLAAARAEICKAVNSKVYSRRLADELGLRQPAGYACASVTSWAAAVSWARRIVGAGRRVGVKDAYGVSGKGMALITGEQWLDKIDRMVTTRARRSGTDRLGLVVEEWVPKAADLNYQFTVSRDGVVRFDFVKEAVTEHGVHKGHRMPARLTDAQHAELVATAQLLGAALAADGYFGVVGVDAMVDPDGGLYPVIEINARNNMSTYQVRLQEEVAGAGRTALARHYVVRLTEPLPFARLQELLAGLLVDRPGGTGLLVNNYACVNAALATAEHGAAAEGRLYGMVIGDDAATVDRLDAEIAGRLAATRLEGSTR